MFSCWVELVHNNLEYIISLMLYIYIFFIFVFRGIYWQKMIDGPNNKTGPVFQTLNNEIKQDVIYLFTQHGSNSR